MNLKHFVRMALAVPTVAALAACGGGSNNAQSPDPFAAVAPVAPLAGATCPPNVGNLAVTELAANQCQISGVLTQSGTLNSDVDWFLEGVLQIGNADNVAVLDIQPGTDIFGDNVGPIDHVLAFPGSALRANGTGSQPVRFLSDDADFNGSGEWGGVFLRGFIGTDLEGTGDQAPNDLDYVVVAEAGATVTVDVGLPGTNAVPYSDNIVLNGVDNTTTLTFVQSHDSARDGFHILNGDPRMSWLLATGSTRDGVWYRDFNGLIKDLMVIHRSDTDGSTGRSGIYASETTDGDSFPRIVNVTLVGRDSTSIPASTIPTANEFGILFADNTDRIRLANVLIANFRHGCYESDTNADLSGIDLVAPGNYLDGVHCANEAGPNSVDFQVARGGSSLLPGTTVGMNNTNGDGLIYYNGAGGALAGANTTFDADSGGIQFTGEIVDRSGNFTAGWYLDNIRGIGNGLVANAAFLNGFLNGDTNLDGNVDVEDTRSSFFMTDDGEGGFNQDVATDTGGYDMTHIGAVRSGNPASAAQFDGWTIQTGDNDGFAVQLQ